MVWYTSGELSTEKKPADSLKLMYLGNKIDNFIDTMMFEACLLIHKLFDACEIRASCPVCPVCVVLSIQLTDESKHADIEKQL
mgnify:CR=1 FL=1